MLLPRASWELVELIRKLLLTGVLIFFLGGTVTQTWFGAFVSLVFMLANTRFQPYAELELDHMSFVSQARAAGRRGLNSS